MATVQPIQQVAADLGIASENLLPHGNDKAKIRLEATAASARAPGKLILVSAMTPTGAGEGKTTTSIGLAQGLAKIGESVCLALREPSLGPTFGMKGGATGGGFLRSTAMLKAVCTRLTFIRLSKAHPTTRRENKSMTTAKYNHPSTVHKYVISVPHT